MHIPLPEERFIISTLEEVDRKLLQNRIIQKEVGEMVPLMPVGNDNHPVQATKLQEAHEKK